MVYQTVSEDSKKNITMKTVYSVEFFHIYTDEKISKLHTASLNYLDVAKKAWDIESDLVVLIDNYNPKVHTLDYKDVLSYLKTKGFNNVFYAFEADMTTNAEVLLNSISSNKFKKKYTNYIAKHDKYPCSLLTATWYLTRLGVFSPKGLIHNSDANEEYRVADRLLSILPRGYRDVEIKALDIIRHTQWASSADSIQALFYPEGSHKKVDLF